MSTEQKLDQLTEMYAQRDMLAQYKAEAIKQALPPEVIATLAEIEAEFSDKAAAVNDNIAALEAEIKADVLTCGATVKGATMMAVWNKGRVSWDGKKLEGMMAIIPGLAEARKEGEPTVSLRAVK